MAAKDKPKKDKGAKANVPIQKQDPKRPKK